MQYEYDASTEVASSEGGPLALLLSLIRLLFIPRGPKASGRLCKCNPLSLRSSLQSSNDLSKDKAYLCGVLLRTFADMTEDHPDYTFVHFSLLNERELKDVLIALAEQDTEVMIIELKRITSIQTDNSNNHTAFLSIIERLLSRNPILVTQSDPLIVDVTTPLHRRTGLLVILVIAYTL